MQPPHIDELRAVVARHDPRLEETVDAIARGETISRADAQRLHDILFLEIAEHEVGDDGLTARGEKLDDILCCLRESMAPGPEPRGALAGAR